MKARAKEFSTDDMALNKVAHNFGLDSDSIVALKSTGLSQKDMLGVAFLAKATEKTIAELLAMRKRFLSWSEVSLALGVPLNFDALADEPETK